MDEKSPVQLSVGVLQCGEVPENLCESFIDYNEMIAQSLRTADPGLSCRTWRVFDGEIPRPDACDAWITTGSRYSVNDDNDWTHGFCGFCARGIATGAAVYRNLLRHADDGKGPGG